MRVHDGWKMKTQPTDVLFSCDRVFYQSFYIEAHASLLLLLFQLYVYISLSGSRRTLTGWIRLWITCLCGLRCLPWSSGCLPWALICCGCCCATVFWCLVRLNSLYNNYVTRLTVRKKEHKIIETKSVT